MSVFVAFAIRGLGGVLLLFCRIMRLCIMGVWGGSGIDLRLAVLGWRG